MIDLKEQTVMQAFFPQTGVIPHNPTVQTTSPTVTQKVTVSAVPSRTDLTVEESNWGWQELRDYVVAQIMSVSGPFPRDAKKEYGIFSRFLKEHGQDGIRVAKAAFEIHKGWWNGAPISINRFTRGSDAYFVFPILQQLQSTQQ